MPIRILSDTEKRKAKRGQTGGGRTSSWKRPYKDYTKIKHTNLIKTSTGKKGQIQEQSGAPGGEKKLHDKSMKRLNELQKLKSRSGTRMTSGAQKKRKEHLQSGGYKAGGDVAKRAKHGLGSLVKKGISKILKPKGVFKPKPVPKAVTDKPFKYDETYTRADDKKIKSMLTKLGDEIKAQPLPSKLKKTMKKLQKAYPHKKAEGGRIGLKHGKFVRAAVPHADIDKYVDKGTGKEDDRKGNRSRVEGSTMKFKKPKKSRGPSAGRQAAGQNRAGRQARRSTYQGGGRIGLKHGGSVGAAVRGHGAEIK